tara:strand:- start:296 stop:532 length:237 start_codon:yes stop_codon:yes gene_type:complete
MTKLIFPTLILLIVLSFYLLNKDISKYSQIIKDQQIKIEEHEMRINSQKNVLLFQGARLRDLEKLRNVSKKEYYAAHD